MNIPRLPGSPCHYALWSRLEVTACLDTRDAEVREGYRSGMAACLDRITGATDVKAGYRSGMSACLD